MKKIKDPNIFLDHILESIVEIKKNTNNLTKNKFIKSVPIQDAVIRRLEIIGEATKNLPSLLKNKNADIPWKKIAGLRDVLIHGYFSIDLDLVWKIIKKDLPKLKKQIEKILGK